MFANTFKRNDTGLFLCLFLYLIICSISKDTTKPIYRNWPRSTTYNGNDAEGWTLKSCKLFDFFGNQLSKVVVLPILGCFVNALQIFRCFRSFSNLKPFFEDQLHKLNLVLL